MGRKCAILANVLAVDHVVIRHLFNVVLASVCHKPLEVLFPLGVNHAPIRPTPERGTVLRYPCGLHVAIGFNRLAEAVERRDDPLGIASRCRAIDRIKPRVLLEVLKIIGGPERGQMLARLLNPLRVALIPGLVVGRDRRFLTVLAVLFSGMPNYPNPRHTAIRALSKQTKYTASPLGG